MDAAQRLTMTTLDRQTLHFAEAVEGNFRFLSAHGFKRTEHEPTFVRFESGGVHVNVYHGRKSFELGLEIGPSAHRDESPYSMSEIIRLIEPGKADEYRNYAARDADGVRDGVRQLAAIFRRYVDAGVLDDANLLARLERQRQTWKNDFARDVNLTQARRRLDGAWHAKNYAEVVALLEPLRDALTPTELHKLEYAKKHMR